MSFDYIIDYPCQVRKTLGEQANEIIISVSEARGRYLALRKAMITTDPSVDVDNQVIKGHMITPIGGETREMMMGDLKQQFIQYDPLMKYCSGCPCNPGESDPERVHFGCYSSIRYPISEKFEELLVRCAVAVMQKAMDREPGLFLKYIFDHRDIVSRIHGMRDRKGEFFETDEPFVIRKKNNEQILDSDLLISMLLGFEIDPKYAKYVFLPFIEIIMDYHTQAREREDEEIAGDTTLCEVVRFGEAIRTAMDLECDVLTQL